jgi:hypothetical protein
MGALVVACGSDDSDCATHDDQTGEAEHATCQTFADKLASCGLVTGSYLGGCTDDNPSVSCVAACFKNASCDQLEAAYCADFVNSFAGCLNECHQANQAPPFECDDGSRLPSGWRCDGAPDCLNGEDELDCPKEMFTCADGSTIPLGWQCDFDADCPRGDDELDCPGSGDFTCNDGTRIPLLKKCDAIIDCEGADDEVDCAMLTCERAAR